MLTHYYGRGDDVLLATYRKLSLRESQRILDMSHYLLRSDDGIVTRAIFEDDVQWPVYSLSVKEESPHYAPRTAWLDSWLAFAASIS